MTRQRRIMTMARLEMLNQHHADQIQRAKENFRLDDIWRGVLRSLLAVTAFYLVVLLMGSALFLEVVLDALTEGGLSYLAALAAALWGALLLGTGLWTWRRRRADFDQAAEYAREWDRRQRELVQEGESGEKQG